MERYIRMQSLHTATLNALTSDNKGFDMEMLGDQAIADGERATFDKTMAEAVAGTLKDLRRNPPGRQVIFI